MGEGLGRCGGIASCAAPRSHRNNHATCTGIARRTRAVRKAHRVRPSPAAQVTGWWTVTSLVPSGKVASTWMSGIISGTPSITSSRVSSVVP